MNSDMLLLQRHRTHQPLCLVQACLKAWQCQTWLQEWWWNNAALTWWTMLNARKFKKPGLWMLEVEMTIEKRKREKFVNPQPNQATSRGSSRCKKPNNTLRQHTRAWKTPAYQPPWSNQTSSGPTWPLTSFHQIHPPPSCLKPSSTSQPQSSSPWPFASCPNNLTPTISSTPKTTISQSRPITTSCCSSSRLSNLSLLISLGFWSIKGSLIHRKGLPMRRMVRRFREKLKSFWLRNRILYRL